MAQRTSRQKGSDDTRCTAREAVIYPVSNLYFILRLLLLLQLAFTVIKLEPGSYCKYNFMRLTLEAINVWDGQYRNDL